MLSLSGDERILTIGQAALIKISNCDRQTNGQSDTQTSFESKYCAYA